MAFPNSRLKQFTSFSLRGRLYSNWLYELAFFRNSTIRMYISICYNNLSNNRLLYYNQSNRRMNHTLQTPPGYQLVKQLGRGATSICSLVKREQDGQSYVMKEIILPQEVSSFKEKQDLHQISIMSVLKAHPRIIQYIEHILFNSKLYIILEYHGGKDLQSVCIQKRQISQQFEEDAIWQICEQLVEGLQFMHQNQLIHRDIKPSNIFINNQKVVKIGDFGASKLTDPAVPNYTRIGTPFYLSPEIINYDNYDSKSDVWSLGCTIYYLAAFKHPFEAKNILKLGKKIAEEKQEHLHHYSDPFNCLIVDMLQKNVNNRLNIQEIKQKYFTEEAKILRSQTVMEVQDLSQLKQPNFDLQIMDLSIPHKISRKSSSQCFKNSHFAHQADSKAKNRVTFCEQQKQLNIFQTLKQEEKKENSIKTFSENLSLKRLKEQATSQIQNISNEDETIVLRIYKSNKKQSSNVIGSSKNVSRKDATRNSKFQPKKKWFSQIEDLMAKNNKKPILFNQRHQNIMKRLKPKKRQDSEQQRREQFESHFCKPEIVFMR